MSRDRPRRLLTAAVALASVTLGPAAPVAAATPVASLVRGARPKPVVLPEASSWVGGRSLISPRTLTDLPSGVPAPPPVKAASWLVADLDSRDVLAGRRVHVPLAPASTLKIFTALALAPGLDRKQVYRGQDADANIDGTKVGIVPGSTYTVDDLLHGLLMSSGNDCANALATLSGGLEAATARMQEVASELGAFDTVARNTSGLDAKGQVSSAYDLALAGAAALDDKQLAKVMRTTAYPFPGVGKSLGRKRERFQTQNHNRLLRNYEGALGIKNGYTIAARGSFVGAARRGGHTYIAVLMRTEGSTWHQSADLLDWAFANGTRARPVGRLVQPGELAAKVGPAVGDEGAVLGVATAAPQPGADPPPSPSPAADALPGVLPADTTLAPPVGATYAGRTALAAAGLGLLAIAWFAGRRFSPGRAGSTRSGRAAAVSGAGGRPRSRSRRVRLPGAGRHRH